ncbi:unnamed protein product [Linum trigynum]|uniref:Uncharacterized protein n=1 Tax=Linum trigynum TaxID=586398 RepID=A0AAV2DVJ0_9ROSI
MTGWEHRSSLMFKGKLGRLSTLGRTDPPPSESCENIIPGGGGGGTHCLSPRGFKIHRSSQLKIGRSPPAVVSPSLRPADPHRGQSLLSHGGSSRSLEEAEPSPVHRHGLQRELIIEEKGRVGMEEMDRQAGDMSVTMIPRIEPRRRRLLLEGSDDKIFERTVPGKAKPAEIEGKKKGSRLVKACGNSVAATLQGTSSRFFSGQGEISYKD